MLPVVCIHADGIYLGNERRRQYAKTGNIGTVHTPACNFTTFISSDFHFSYRNNQKHNQDTALSPI